MNGEALHHVEVNREGGLPMSLFDVRHLRSGAVAFVVASLAMVGPARAEAPIKLCIPETPSKAVIVPNIKGECVNTKTVKYNRVQFPGPAELETLNAVLAHVTFVESGVAGKPTIQFYGVNVQLVNGEGKTESVNGEGNLAIGYDENPLGREQTGSHNLILGEQQTFKSYGGIVAGHNNSITGPFASVTAGEHNTASGLGASVSGGIFGTASAWATSVSGGLGNSAAGYGASVSGGRESTAAGGEANWIGGGYKNAVPGTLVRRASIFGGNELTAKGEYEAIP
jgi:hypothetical protein